MWEMSPPESCGSPVRGGQQSQSVGENSPRVWNGATGENLTLSVYLLYLQLLKQKFMITFEKIFFYTSCLLFYSGLIKTCNLIHTQ